MPYRVSTLPNVSVALLVARLTVTPFGPPSVE
jgi:hypothetical protein